MGQENNRQAPQMPVPTSARNKPQVPDNVGPAEPPTKVENKVKDPVVAEKPAAIEVRAKRDGYYEGRRTVDAVFDVESFERLGEWMECTDPELEKAHLEAIKKKNDKIRASFNKAGR